MIFTQCVCVCVWLCVCGCVCLWGSVCVLGGRRLAVVLHPGDGGFAEETVLVVHQVLVDTGSVREEQRDKQR